VRVSVEDRVGGGLDDGGNVISSVISDWGVPLV